MKFEIINSLSIPKIGFGTWKIGGEAYAEPRYDGESLLALRTALESGYTHFDTAEYYASGHSEELIGKATREMGIPRSLSNEFLGMS